MTSPQRVSFRPYCATERECVLRFAREYHGREPIDVPIQPDNSGGPLMVAAGKIVGNAMVICNWRVIFHASD